MRMLESVERIKKIYQMNSAVESTILNLSISGLSYLGYASTRDDLDSGYITHDSEFVFIYDKGCNRKANVCLHIDASSNIDLEDINIALINCNRIFDALDSQFLKVFRPDMDVLEVQIFITNTVIASKVIFHTFTDFDEDSKEDITAKHIDTTMFQPLIRLGRSK